jgi:hypothetical protein
LAVAVGTVTRVPVIAARMSVLRTFVKFVPFAVRAPKQPIGLGEGVLVSDPVRIEEVLWEVPSRSGTTAAGLIGPVGC